MIPLVAISALLIGQPPAGDGPPSIALFPVATHGLTPAARSAAERAVCDAFMEIDSIALQDPQQSWRQLQPLEQGGFTCEGEPACLAQAGEALQVAQVAHAEVVARDDFYYLQLRLADVGNQTELRRVQAQLPRDPARLPAELRAAVFRLVAPERHVGALQVLAPGGASVAVDGEEQGAAPLEGPIAPISVGEHAVRLQLEGGEAVERMAEVRFEQITVVDLREAPSGLGSIAYRPVPRSAPGQPPAWAAAAGAVPDTRSQWPLWTGAVTGIGAVGIAAAAALTWALAVDANQRALDWAIAEHGGRPPEGAPDIEERYYQPLAESQTLQTVSAALAVGASVTATATLGLIGYALVAGAPAAEDPEAAEAR